MIRARLVALSLATVFATASALAAESPGLIVPEDDVVAGRSCGTPAPTAEQAEQARVAVQRYLDELGARPVGGQIRVAWHVIHNGTHRRHPELADRGADRGAQPRLRRHRLQLRAVLGGSHQQPLVVQHGAGHRQGDARQERAGDRPGAAAQPLHVRPGAEPARLGVPAAVAPRVQQAARRRHPLRLGAGRPARALQPRPHGDARDRPLPRALSHVPERLQRAGRRGRRHGVRGQPRLRLSRRPQHLPGAGRRPDRELHGLHGRRLHDMPSPAARTCGWTRSSRSIARACSTPARPRPRSRGRKSTRRGACPADRRAACTSAARRPTRSARRPCCASRCPRASACQLQLYDIAGQLV